MHLTSRAALLTAVLAGAGFYALVPSFAQQATPEPAPAAAADSNTVTIAEPDCPFFGVERERFLLRNRKIASGAGNATRQFYARGGNAAPTPRSGSFDLSKSGRGGVIDGPVWAALQAAGITPAQQTTDYEFVRRYQPGRDRAYSFG